MTDKLLHYNHYSHFISQELSPTSDINLVRSLTNLIDCHLDDFKEPDLIETNGENNINCIIEVCYSGILTFPQNPVSQVKWFKRCLSNISQRRGGGYTQISPKFLFL